MRARSKANALACPFACSDFSGDSSNGEIALCGLVQSCDVCVLENYRLVT